MLKIILGILTSMGLSGMLIFEYGWPDFDHHHHHNPGHPVTAPEIDPAAAMSGLTLLAGGLAVLRGRRTRTEKNGH